MSCGIGLRCGLDLALLWLWSRPAATAPIRPLAWEPPYAAGVAQEMAKRHNKTKQNKTKQKPSDQGSPARLVEVRELPQVIGWGMG